MPFIQNWARQSKFFYLQKERIPRNPPFMIHKGIGNKNSLVSGLQYPLGKIGILARMYFSEASSGLECFFGDPHIKTSWFKFLRIYFISPYPTRCQQGGHNIINCLLKRCKTRMCGIRSAKTMVKFVSQKTIHIGKIIFGQ